MSWGYSFRGTRMRLEGLDKSISMALAIGSAAAGLWAHRSTLAKEKKRMLRETQQAEESAQKKYADQELKRYAAERDFGHIQRDLDQLKANVLHLSQDNDKRLDQLERQFERFAGALEILTDLIRHGRDDKA